MLLPQTFFNNRLTIPSLKIDKITIFNKSGFLQTNLFSQHKFISITGGHFEVGIWPKTGIITKLYEIKNILTNFNLPQCNTCWLEKRSGMSKPSNKKQKRKKTVIQEYKNRTVT